MTYCMERDKRDQSMYRITINDLRVHIRLVPWEPKLTIGGDLQYHTRHMAEFKFPEIGESHWYSITTEAYEKELIHIRQDKDGNFYCNCGEELDINNNEYPYLFMSKLRRLAIEQELKDLFEKERKEIR